jgi:hypothetical protein
MTHGHDDRVKTRTQAKPHAAPSPQAERPLSPAGAFVVQFRDDAGRAGERFAGRAEHMKTGHSARFESPEELRAFFERVLSAVQASRSDKG